MPFNPTKFDRVRLSLDSWQHGGWMQWYEGRKFFGLPHSDGEEEEGEGVAVVTGPVAAATAAFVNGPVLCSGLDPVVDTAQTAQAKEMLATEDKLATLLKSKASEWLGNASKIKQESIAANPIMQHPTEAQSDFQRLGVPWLEKWTPDVPRWLSKQLPKDALQTRTLAAPAGDDPPPWKVFDFIEIFKFSKKTQGRRPNCEDIETQMASFASELRSWAAETEKHVAPALEFMKQVGIRCGAKDMFFRLKVVRAAPAPQRLRHLLHPPRRHGRARLA